MPGILGFRGISVEDEVTKVQELLFGPKSIDLQLAFPKNIPANKLKGGDLEEIVLTRT